MKLTESVCVFQLPSEVIENAIVSSDMNVWRQVHSCNERLVRKQTNMQVCTTCMTVGETFKPTTLVLMVTVMEISHAFVDPPLNNLSGIDSCECVY